MISIVCPFYNEEAIIEGALRHMFAQLRTLDEDWELILVNDGSRDRSYELVKPLEALEPRLRVIGYVHNQGRGFALKTGIEVARGEIVVTTEVDCSWGDDIVHRIVSAFREHPYADMVVASPNLQGGGYRNVPRQRVMVSRIGNRILRVGHSTSLTMYTGMTRGYRREKFLALPVDEKEKEFHLEIARKAEAFGYRIVEIPAVLEWKAHKFAGTGTRLRKSSANISKLIRTHLLFSLAAAPFRYILPAGMAISLVGLMFMVWAFYNLITGGPSIYLALLSLSLMLFGFLMITIGILAYQGLELLQEIWRLRSEVKLTVQSMRAPR